MLPTRLRKAARAASTVERIGVLLVNFGTRRMSGQCTQSCRAFQPTRPSRS
jgi:hypothetical protein